MNLIEAIKSGRAFRHKGSCQWLTKEDLEYMPASVTEMTRLYLSISDLLADDWETHDPAVTITRSDFWQAVQESHQLKLTGFHVDANVLAKKLGLE